MKPGRPIRRKKPLLPKGYPRPRRTRLRPVRLKPRRQAATRDAEYLAWVRTQPCSTRPRPEWVPLFKLVAQAKARPSPDVALTHWSMVWVDTPCRGRIEAHHAGGDRGLSQKASDDTAIALCSGHHRDLEDVTGCFKGWTKAQLRCWQDAQIVGTRYARAVFLAPAFHDNSIPW